MYIAPDETEGCQKAASDQDQIIQERAREDAGVTLPLVMWSECDGGNALAGT